MGPVGRSGHQLVLQFGPCWVELVQSDLGDRAGILFIDIVTSHWLLMGGLGQGVATL